MYRVSWMLPDLNHVQIEAEVPDGCTAELTLPRNKEQRTVHLTAGKFVTTYETDEPLAKPHSAAETLQQLISCAGTRKVLEEELPALQQLLGYTRPYPLQETLNNLNYPQEHIRRINEKLRDVYD